jgi:protein Tob/BTG
MPIGFTEDISSSAFGNTNNNNGGPLVMVKPSSSTELSPSKECEYASWWWTSQLNLAMSPTVSYEQLHHFQKTLQRILEKKYENHWYPDCPEKGSAYRSIMFEHGIIDSVLAVSAKEARITNLRARFPTELIMWVDPGAIRIAYTHSPKKIVVLYQKSDINDSYTSTQLLYQSNIDNCRLKLYNSISPSNVYQHAPLTSAVNKETIF